MPYIYDQQYDENYAVRKLIITVWENLGKPTNLIPVTDFSDTTTLDPTLPGYRTIYEWLIQGFERIESYRPAQHGSWPIREKNLRKDVLTINFSSLSVYEVDGWQDGGLWAGYAYIENTALATNWLGYYEPGEDTLGYYTTPLAIFEPIDFDTGEDTGLYFKCYKTGYEHFFISYGDCTRITVLMNEEVDELPWDTFASGHIYFNYINLRDLYIHLFYPDAGSEQTEEINVPVSHITIKRIRDLTNNRLLSRAPLNDSFENAFEFGIPTMWKQAGQQLFFDRTVKGFVNYEIEYELTGIVALEEALSRLERRYHYLCGTWATYLGKLNAQEEETAYIWKQNFEQELKTIMDEINHLSYNCEGGFEA